MNRIWAALAILLVLLGICAWSTTETVRMTTDISQTLTDFQSSVAERDTEQAKAYSEQAAKDWKNYHDTMAFYIPHERLEGISQTLSAMCSFLSSGTEDEAMAECQKALNQLQTLMDTELPYLNNIF